MWASYFVGSLEKAVIGEISMAKAYRHVGKHYIIHEKHYGQLWLVYS